LELLQYPDGQTPKEKEFAMTGEEMLRELETKARAQGQEDGRQEGRQKGRQEGREEGARRMVRLAFEHRFGAVPSLLDEALGQIRDLGVLERIMAACISASKDEVTRLLCSRVH
jgi:flagellar biosynthesis/type III secretory pathway protein FliH